MDQTFGPYFTARCLNVKQNMDVVNSNRGKMYLRGQHNPMNWDSLTVAMHLIAENWICAQSTRRKKLRPALKTDVYGF
jgi:hypothetical protein